MLYFSLSVVEFFSSYSLDLNKSFSGLDDRLVSYA